MNDWYKDAMHKLDYAEHRIKKLKDETVKDDAIKNRFIKNEIKEVAEMLDVSISTASRRIKQMNDEMVAEGYYAEQGKVPVQSFHENYPYIPKSDPLGCP